LNAVDLSETAENLHFSLYLTRGYYSFCVQIKFSEVDLVFLKGVYIVFFRLEETSVVKVGALGGIKFEAGVYAYIGSAMNSLESRVERHFSGKKENAYWHIDYFSAQAEPLGFCGLAVESKWECILSEAAKDHCEAVEGFCASDCSCNSHLYRIQRKAQ